MKDYSRKMRSMDFHRGTNYEMNIVLKKPEFRSDILSKTLNTIKLNWELQSSNHVIMTSNFEYIINTTKLEGTDYNKLKISQLANNQVDWTNENELLTVTYLIWVELAGKIQNKSGEGYSINEWDKVRILNNIEIKDFESYYNYQLFTATDLKESLYGHGKRKINVETKLIGDAYVCSANHDTFNNALEFWIEGTKELVQIGTGNSDMSDGRFLPISEINLELELNSLCSSIDLLIDGEIFKSAMKMRHDKIFAGWYFIKSENKYFIIDLVRPN